MEEAKKGQIAWLVDVADGSALHCFPSCNNNISMAADSVADAEKMLRAAHAQMKKRLGDKTPPIEELFDYVRELAKARTWRR